MIDRILLILLVLLLPLGIITAKVLTGDIQIPNQSSETEKKIEATLNRLTQQITAPAPSSVQFSVTGVAYASDSSLLNIGLVVPVNNKPVWVSLAGNKKYTKKEASPSAVTHFVPSSFVIPPNGNTAHSIKIPVGEFNGILEVRIEQDNSFVDIRYDLDKYKQITF